jgi:hypothetical protein
MTTTTLNNQQAGFSVIQITYRLILLKYLANNSVNTAKQFIDHTVAFHYFRNSFGLINRVKRQ